MNVRTHGALVRTCAAVVASAAVIVSMLALGGPAEAAPAAPAAASIGAGAQSAAMVLHRWVGASADKFDLAIIPRHDGQDTYEVTAAGGRVSIKGSTPATILAGFNAYIGQVLHQSVSWNESNLHLPAVLPGTSLIQNTANVANRYVGNEVESGYTGPYRTLEDWKQLIDVYAMHGLNEVFMPLGTAAVYLDVFEQFGYSQSDLLKWIPQAAHQPWWMLQNMSGGPDPLTVGQVTSQATLGRQVADYLRSLGMVPVLAGYFGTVPSDFAAHAAASDPGASVTVVPQGTWAGGYARPDWLDPNSGVFSSVAQKFYSTSSTLLGDSTMYNANVLQEGGNAGGVNVPGAAVAIQSAMQKAQKGSVWVLLGWQSNPPAQVVSAVNPSETFVVDGLSDRYNGLTRDSTWKGIPYAFGTIWNFGGHTTLGAQMSVQNTRYFDWLDAPGSAMKGLAILPEGGENNPAEFDFFAGLAWRTGPVDLNTWFNDYSYRRYGINDPNASAAWDIVGQTAYSLPSDDGWSEAADGLFGAQPSLDVDTAAAWSPPTQRYDMGAFEKALSLLLKASAAVKATPTYKYDLMSISRQVMDNLARTLLPKIKSAYDAGNVGDFDKLTAAWLSDMDLTDQIAGTDPQQLLGSWIAAARDAASTTAEADAQERDARAIITTWTAPDGTLTDLNDYANREWNGLVGGYYKARWSAYFTSLDNTLKGTGNTTPPDFGAMGAAFVNGTAAYEPKGGYATKPIGDIVALATTALERYAFATTFVPTPAPLPAPPGAGVTQLSELGFVSDQEDPTLGPTARNTEIGDATTHVRNPITLDGKTYPEGIGVNAPSAIVFNLGGQCTQFDAIAGIDATMDLPGKSPNVIFTVLGDGHQLYTSGHIVGGGATPASPATVKVDVTGVKLLTLKVDYGLSNNWFDRADWANATVTCGGPIPAPAPPGTGVTQLSHLPFLASTVSPDGGPVARDTAIADTGTHVAPPLTIGGVQYRYGLGVQSDTSLSFNVGARCTLFSAYIGIDATMDQPGKSPSVNFTVLGDGKPLYTSANLTGGAAVHATADITGVKTLTLVADHGLANDWFDRADWADAKVTCTAPTPQPPVTTAALSAPAPSSGWYTTPPTVTLSTDASARIEYSLDDAEWTEYTGPITMPEGITTLRYRATGADGAVEAVQTLATVKVDTIKPTIAATIVNRTVVLAASDSGSGVAAIEYSTDAGATWRPYSTPIAAGNGALTVSYRAIDVAGNVSADEPPVTIPAESGKPAIHAPSSVVAGSTLKVSLAGFPAGATVTLTLHSQPLALGTVTTDSTGAASFSARIPRGFAAGSHQIQASVDGKILASRPIAVVAATVLTPTPTAATGAHGDLAHTGSDLAMPLGMALLILALGAIAVVASRVGGRGTRGHE